MGVLPLPGSLSSEDCWREMISGGSDGKGNPEGVAVRLHAQMHAMMGAVPTAVLAASHAASSTMRRAGKLKRQQPSLPELLVLQRGLRRDKCQTFSKHPQQMQRIDSSIRYINHRYINRYFNKFRY